MTDVHDKHHNKVITKKKIVYPLALIDRIGELSRQMFHLRNLYDEDEYDITVVTFPPNLKPRTNKAVYDIATRGVNVAHSTDSKLMWACHSHKDLSLQTHGDTLYVFTRLDNLQIMFFEKFKNKRQNYYFSLSDSDIERGYQLRKKFGIPESAPTVVLHVREEEYLQSSDAYRNANIENYIPAINYLIDKGYYIIRIGDNTMKRFVNSPPQLIDAPFHEEYIDFVEPYFIAVSNFFIGCASGPDALATGFGTPALFVNGIFQAGTWGGNGDLYVPKKVYSNKLGRYLTYEEFILSPALLFNEDKSLQQSGIEFRENSPEEILMAVKEMDERLDNVYSSPQEEIAKINRRFKTIQAKAYYYRKCTIDANVWASYPLYIMYLSNMQISMEFIKMNPDFLGHEWPV